MKKALLLALMSVMPITWAQNAPLEGISESTDPAKVREVERRAEEIRDRQQQGASSGASDASSARSGSSESRESRRMHKREMKREHSDKR